MTITLQQEPVFTIESNGHKLTGFTVESEWEGFKKMRRGPEYVILATTKAVPPFTAVFSGLLAAFMEGKPESDEYCALVASPMLHAAFTGEPPVNPLQATVDQLRSELAGANQLAQLNGEIAADLKAQLLEIGQQVKIGTVKEVAGVPVITWTTRPTDGMELYATPIEQKCGMCGYVGTRTDDLGQCPNCRWDELQAIPAMPTESKP